jgi:predicted flap endonuclease-1-like 5' DNA nuclease/nitrogen fixation-related uncharacterized protein
MMRWLIRLSIGASVAALAIYLWSRLNQDYDDDEIEDEIPLEFDVPMESTGSTLDAPIEFDVPLDGAAASLDVPAEAPSLNGDTGVGPGADLDQPAPAATGGDSDTTETDDLTVIRGIGPVFQKRLNELGIMTFRQLADTKPDMLDAEGINGVGVDLESWIEQARDLAEEKNA